MSAILATTPESKTQGMVFKDFGVISQFVHQSTSPLIASLLLVARPGAPSSVLALSSKARSP